ncbi:MAG: glycosyltransferase family 2 protein [Conexibacter sp.]|jgi:glycosyltransferase involved in cell wall biosynthesis|nr:glycosyltransferase family 2 protein [Conexibacter sp.]
MTLTYAVVTPARDEHANLSRLAASMTAQTRLPTWWVIVDDGSDDGTDELGAQLAAEHAWILLRTPEPATGGALTEGRREGRDLLAFRRGADALPAPVDVVVKVDADTSFDPEYFATLMERFEQQPDLGLAGGSCYELEDGEWVRKKVAGTHPRGASRAYRWDCFEASGRLEPKMGWDGLDEVQASMLGYRTAIFTDFGFRHHRATGGRERDRLRASSVLGHASWYMGYRPSYLLLRALYRTRREGPLALAMVWGYASAAARRTPRCPEPGVIQHLREQQRLRTVIARGVNP